MQKLADKVYVCDHCSTVRKTESGIMIHESKCTKNVPKISAEQVKLEKNRTILEDIRCTSKNIHELITRLQEFWLTFGIKVTFKQYPSSFNPLLSNSHNAPKGYKQNWCGRDKDMPKGYPGWGGRFEGTVELLNITEFQKIHGKKDVSFCDLNNNSFDSLKNMPKAYFLQSGSGGGGNRFSYEGYLFVYDFPAMHEEWELNGGEYDVLDVNYQQAIRDYNEVYDKSVNKFIDNNSDFNSLKTLILELQDVLLQMDNAKSLLTTKLKNDFNQQYDIKIPVQDWLLSAFTETNELMKTACKVDHVIKQKHPELEKLMSYIGGLKDRIHLYKMAYPELFI